MTTELQYPFICHELKLQRTRFSSVLDFCYYSNYNKIPTQLEGVLSRASNVYFEDADKRLHIAAFHLHSKCVLSNQRIVRVFSDVLVAFLYFDICQY